MATQVSEDLKSYIEQYKAEPKRSLLSALKKQTDAKLKCEKKNELGNYYNEKCKRVEAIQYILDNSLPDDVVKAIKSFEIYEINIEKAYVNFKQKKVIYNKLTDLLKKHNIKYTENDNTAACQTGYKMHNTDYYIYIN